MSHEIMGDRFISREHPAWHELGTTFPKEEEVSASEAAKRVSGDIKVVKCPLTYTHDGAIFSAADHVAIVREPTKDDDKHVVFGVVGKAWVPDSYVELAESLDELSRRYHVETAGVLKDGRLAFMSFKGEGWDVLGDPMEAYFIANFSLRPGEAHRIFHTPVRVVCWNTLNAGLQEASITLSIKHGTDAKQQVGIAGNVVARFTEAQAKTKETMEAFAKRVCTVEEAKRIFAAAFPEPPLPKRLRIVRDMTGGDEGVELFRRSLDLAALQSLEKVQEQHEKGIARAGVLRVTAQHRYDAFEPKNLRGTVWAAYNAATEVADWREGRTAAEGSLWGGRAQEKRRAFAEALQVVSN